MTKRLAGLALAVVTLGAFTASPRMELKIYCGGALTAMSFTLSGPATTQGSTRTQAVDIQLRDSGSSNVTAYLQMTNSNLTVAATPDVSLRAGETKTMTARVTYPTAVRAPTANDIRDAALFICR